MNQRRLTILTALLAAVSTGCASASSSRPAIPSGGPDVPIPMVSHPEAIAQAREDSVRRPYTVADIEFMAGMIHHHSQAVKIAGWAESHGASRAVQTLANRIVHGQNTEIGIMQTWLRDRNKPVPMPNHAGMPAMAGMDHGDHGGASSGAGGSGAMMPGMLSDEQLKQLDAARGNDFDRLFLTFMIQHHRGAITMVEKLLATPGAGQDEAIFKFSADVQSGQTTEINRMYQMLNALPER